MAYTEKRIFLSEENEDTNIEVVESIDEDSNQSVMLRIAIFEQDEYQEIPLHKNALKGLIQELIKYL